MITTNKNLEKEQYKKRLKQSANTINQIMRVVRLQIEILEKLGFSEDNLERLLNMLSPEQHESFNNIRRNINIYEQNKACDAQQGILPRSKRSILKV